MPDHISPYELLCASRPRSPQAFVTTYDLYSRAHQPGGDSSAYAAQAVSPALQTPAPASAAQPAAGRTHYIADIHSRHSSASRRSDFSGPPLT